MTGAESAGVVRFLRRLVCRVRGHRWDPSPVYCGRCGIKRRIPYHELAPQDQVDRIAYDEGLEFDAALDEWARRHGDD